MDFGRVAIICLFLLFFFGIVFSASIYGNRLPMNNTDESWGSILNEYLLVEHMGNGTHGNTSVQSLNVSYNMSVWGYQFLNNTVSVCVINKPCYLGDYVTNNSYQAYNISGCRFTALNPLNSTVVNNLLMDFSLDGFHNYTYTPTVAGVFKSFMNCEFDIDKGNQSMTFLAVTAPS